MTKNIKTVKHKATHKANSKKSKSIMAKGKTTRKKPSMVKKKKKSSVSRSTKVASAKTSKVKKVKGTQKTKAIRKTKRSKATKGNGKTMPAVAKKITKKLATKQKAIKRQVLKSINTNLNQFQKILIKLRDAKAAPLINNIKIVKDFEKVLASLEASLIKKN